MTTQVEIFDICLNNIKNDWSITKQQIDDNFKQIDANIVLEIIKMVMDTLELTNIKQFKYYRFKCNN